MRPHPQSLPSLPRVVPKEPGMQADPVPAHPAPEGTMKKEGNPADHNHQTAPDPPAGL